jgi:uncharacterized membrane protein YfhO
VPVVCYRLALYFGKNIPLVMQHRPLHSEVLQTQGGGVTRNSGTPWIVFGLLVLMAGFVFKDYLLFKKIFFFRGVGSDSMNCAYPYLCNVADQVWQYGFPQWSFNFGMGHNLFPFFLQDPFNIFLYAAGKDHILYGMAFKEVFKVILSGLVFFYYLRQVGLQEVTAMAGSLMYAFCGFMIVGSCWSIFSFEVFNMALLLLAFELLFVQKKFYLFPVAVFLLCISQPFNVYLYGLFIAAYAVLRLFHTKTFTFKRLILLYVRMAGLAIVGMLLSGPMLLENVMQLLESPRGSGVSSVAHSLLSAPPLATINKFELGSCLMRFFSSDMMGTGQYYNGALNYLEVPAFYCGLPCLLLMPQVFHLMEKRVRIVFGVFIACWTAPLIFPYLRHAIWLFSGDYYRGYSFFVAFVFLFYSMLALDALLKGGKISYRVLAVTLMVLFVMLVYPFFPAKELLYYPERPPRYQPLLVFASVALVVYATWLALMRRFGAWPYYQYLFVTLIVAELSYLSAITLNNMEAIDATAVQQRKGYNDHTTDALKYLGETDHSFYRIDKGYFSSFARFFSYNDGMAQGYKGTSSYNSFNQLYYVFYMQLMGISHKEHEYESRWMVGLLHRPLLESANSVKYVLTKGFRLPSWETQFDSIAIFGDVKLLRNKYVVPFGYTYKNYLKESSYNKLTPDQKDMVSLRACVLKDGDEKKYGLQEFQLSDTIMSNGFNNEDHVGNAQDRGVFSAQIYRQYTNELRKDTLVITHFDDRNISGSINLHEDKMMYLSVPYDAGWVVKADGAEQEKIPVFAGMTGLMLKGGHHEVEMNYHLRFLRKGVILSIFGLLLYSVSLFYRKNN